MTENISIIIKRATILDIPCIQSVAHNAWPEAFKDILKPDQIDYMLNWMYSEEGLERQFWIQNHLFVLAIVSNEVVGFCGFEHHFEGSKTTKVHKLYVLPSYIGKGVGHELMSHISQKAIDTGDLELVLNVNKYNKAVDFYKKLNFSIVKEMVIDIGKGYVMDDYLMSKKLL